MNKTFLGLAVFIFLFIGIKLSNAQVYSSKDIINQYDGFLVTLNDMTINTNDEDYKEHVYIIIVTLNVGNEKIVKFLYPDDLIMNNVKNYNDTYWAISFTAKKNNSILVPAMFNLPYNNGAVSLKLEGYAFLNEQDIALMNQLSTGFAYTSSNMAGLMDQAYKYLASSSDPNINRPNSTLQTTAEVLAQGLKTRPGVMALGNPYEVTYAVPLDPKKVIGSNILTQGKRTLESKISSRSSDLWNVTVTKLTDVKMVKAEPYYVKIQGVFQDLINQSVISADKREGNLVKAQSIIDDDLVIGKRNNVYLNDEAVKQLSNLLYFLKAGVRAKSDTSGTTSELMFSNEREALSYIENNLKENDFNLNNQYIFDDFISSSLNRGSLQKEIDLIRRYYQIK